MTRDELITISRQELDKLPADELDIIVKHFRSEDRAELAGRLADEAVEMWSGDHEAGRCPRSSRSSPRGASAAVGPWGCAQDKCERWHAGVDLTGAPQGALVIAPEDALIVGLDKGWTDGTRAIFLRTDSNLFLVLGGVIAGSHKEFGLTTGRPRPPRREARPHRRQLRHAALRDLRRDARPHGELAVVEGRPGRPRVCSTPSTTSSAWSAPTRRCCRRASASRRSRTSATTPATSGPRGTTPPTRRSRRPRPPSASTVDGKWGPATEDAIHGALQAPCGSLEDCPTGDGAPTGKSTDALKPLRIVGAVVAGAAVVSVGAAIYWSVTRG
jgi:hypothetical protein